MPKISNVKWKLNDWLMFKVACSATESTSGSVVVRNGLIALRYLNVGINSWNQFDSEIITKNIVKNKVILKRKISEFLSLFLLFICIIKIIIDKIVGIIINIPEKLVTKFIIVLSKIKPVRNIEVEKIGICQIKFDLFFLTSGNDKTNSPKSIIKNWLPPHEDNPRIENKPANEILTIEIFLLSLIPERKKYTPKIPKSNPSGSDLNHPKPPLIIIGIEIENNREPIRPADVPPIVLINPKIMKDVNEPTTIGKTIV